MLLGIFAACVEFTGALARKENATHMLDQIDFAVRMIHGLRKFKVVIYYSNSGFK